MPTDSDKATTNATVPREDLLPFLQAVNGFSKDQIREPLLTAGFTITNVRQRIDASLADPDFLGWFLKFGAKKPDGSVTSFSFIGEVMLIKFFVRGPLGGTRTLATEPVANPGIVPKLLWQEADPGNDGRNEAYQPALNRTKLGFADDATLLTKHLTHHTPWAEAVFLRRSDLRFLRMYLRTFKETYNDLLFTGSKVNYDVMHAPPLRRNQFSLEGGPPPSGKVPDSSKAFSLKVEPFRNKNISFIDPLDTGGDTAPPVSGPVGGTTSSPPPSPAGKPFPVSAIGIPCPDYWEVLEEIEDVVKPASPAEFAALLKTFEDNTSSQGIDGISTGSTAISGPTDNFLLRILTFLIDQLTRLRDAWREA